MPQSNRSILEAANSAIKEGDFDGFLSHCAEDIHWDMVGDELIEGKTAVKRWMERTYVNPPKFSAENFISEDNRLAVFGKIEITDKNGASTHFRYCDVWQIRDGKLADLKAYAVKID